MLLEMFHVKRFGAGMLTPGRRSSLKTGQNPLFTGPSAPANNCIGSEIAVRKRQIFSTYLVSVVVLPFSSHA